MLLFVFFCGGGGGGGKIGGGGIVTMFCAVKKSVTFLQQKIGVLQNQHMKKNTFITI